MSPLRAFSCMRWHSLCQGTEGPDFKSGASDLLASPSSTGTSGAAFSVPSLSVLAKSVPAGMTALTRRQKLLYALLFIGGRWGWTRLNQYMIDENWGGHPQVGNSELRPSLPLHQALLERGVLTMVCCVQGDWRRRAYRVCSWLENVYRAASIANFLVFLLNGRSVVFRILPG